MTLLSLGFLSGLALDALRGKLEENAEGRAVELSELLTRLGPSFIKVRMDLFVATHNMFCKILILICKNHLHSNHT